MIATPTPDPSYPNSCGTAGAPTVGRVRSIAPAAMRSIETCATRPLAPSVASDAFGTVAARPLTIGSSGPTDPPASWTTNASCVRETPSTARTTTLVEPRKSETRFCSNGSSFEVEPVCAAAASDVARTTASARDAANRTCDVRIAVAQATDVPSHALTIVYD